MLAKVPLLVSDRPFAREVCSDAALYFDPLDAESIAAQVRRAMSNADLRLELISAGERRYVMYPSSEEKNALLADLVLRFASSCS